LRLFSPTCSGEYLPRHFATGKSKLAWLRSRPHPFPCAPSAAGCSDHICKTRVTAKRELGCSRMRCGRWLQMLSTGISRLDFASAIVAPIQDSLLGNALLRLQSSCLQVRRLRHVEEYTVRMKLRDGIPVHRTDAIVFEFGHNPLARRLGGMIATARSFQAR
jgi:hypothetical protein